MFMHVFSTVLFVNGNPVGYKVFKQNDRLVLNPAESPGREVLPPSISARHLDGYWLVEGTNDKDLIDQVIEDVTLNEGKLPTTVLSAAP
jgi:hypothetical protein